MTAMHLLPNVDLIFMVYCFAITCSTSVVTFTFKFSTLNPQNQTWVGWSLCGKDPYRCIFRMICHLYLNTQHNINNGQLDSEKKFKAQQDILLVVSSSR